MSNAIPKGWSQSSIGEITATNSLFSDGDWVESKDQDPAGENRLIQLADIGDGKFVNKSSRFMNDEQFERLKCTELVKNDILIARMPDPLGRACLYPLEGNRAATVVDVAVIRTENADHYWLMSAINSSAFRHQIDLNASGTTRTRIARGILSEIELLKPPLPEQQKIATILSSVDDVIEKTRAQIDKLKDLKTGMMQELLTKGIGHTEFKDSPVGQIPAEWSVVKLKDIADVKGGKRMPKGRPFAGHVTPYPYIRVTDFRDGTVRTDNLQYVLPEDQKTIKRYIVGKDDLYISIAGTLGLIGSIPDELDGAQLTENAAKIVFHDQSKISPVFYKHILLSAVAQDQLSLEKGIGGGVPKLALFRIEAITLPLPTFEEQNAISKILDAIDVRIQLVVNKIKAVQLTKKALMQDLLTGKVRVKLTDKESAAR